MSSHGQHFDRMVAAGNPVGEVIAVDRFLVRVRGMQPCAIHALVMFEDGSKGFVHQVMQDQVVVLHLGTGSLTAGMVVVVQHQELVCKVGKDYIGRVVSVLGDPLDGKGPIAADDVGKVFGEAPLLAERKMLSDQLESGVVAIDSLFPIVRGQRMALLGDGKSGKSTMVTQLAINQKNTDQIVVYCLIAKRRSDVDMLLTRLSENGGLEKAIVVVSTMFESPIMSYIAPYVACTMAEYLWRKCNQDTIIVYDDLTAHAHMYREVSLLSGMSPGRDSYPGDMFYAHSSLLERAGRLQASGKCLTSIPVVHVAGGDITAYLPTNIMSITDGQWIMDMDVFRSGVRPAVSMGLSVTRAGGVGHSKRQKTFAAQALKALADYRQAQEFSHFGSELGPEAKQALVVGQRLNDILTQSPAETYSLMAQQLMLDTVLNANNDAVVDMGTLKLNANDFAAKITGEDDYERVLGLFTQTCVKNGFASAGVGNEKPNGHNSADTDTSGKDEKKDGTGSDHAADDAKHKAKTDTSAVSSEVDHADVSDETNAPSGGAKHEDDKQSVLKSNDVIKPALPVIDVSQLQSGVVKTSVAGATGPPVAADVTDTNNIDKKSPVESEVVLATINESGNLVPHSDSVPPTAAKSDNDKPANKNALAETTEHDA